MSFPIIAQDGFAKSLVDRVNISDKYWFVTGAYDPTLTPTDAIPGSIFFRTDIPGFYQKLDSGVTTNWNFVKSGSTWYNGSGVPSDTLGADGDYYLDNVGGNVYHKGSGTWV